MPRRDPSSGGFLAPLSMSMRLLPVVSSGQLAASQTAQQAAEKNPGVQVQNALTWDLPGVELL